MVVVFVDVTVEGELVAEVGLESDVEDKISIPVRVTLSCTFPSPSIASTAKAASPEEVAGLERGSDR